MKTMVLAASFLLSTYSALAATGGYVIYGLPHDDFNGVLEAIEQVYGQNNSYGIKLVIETTNRKILLSYDHAEEGMTVLARLRQGMNIDLSKCVNQYLANESKDWSVQSVIECPKFGKSLPILSSSADLQKQISRFSILGPIDLGSSRNAQ